MRHVLLLGVTHHDHGQHWDATRAEVTAFLDWFRLQASTFGPGLVAEESSAEALSPMGVLPDWCEGASQVQFACGALGHRYLAIDPTDGECVALGVPTSYEASFAAQRGNPEPAARRLDGREEEWTRRVVGSGATRVLAVVGRAHLETFASKLRQAGFTVAAQEYKPPR